MPVPIPPASPAGPPVVSGSRELEPIAALLDGAPKESPLATTDGFAKVVNNALDSASGLEYSADSASTTAAVGELSSVSDLRIAGADPDGSSDPTMANRGRALAAFNEILAMQM